MQNFMPQLNAAGTAWVANIWEGPGQPAPIINTSAVQANANAVATLPAVAGKTNVLLGFDLVIGGATVGLIASVSVTGLLGGTQTFPIEAPTGVGLVRRQSFNFDPPIQASAANVAIVVTIPALGAGNTLAQVNARGAQL